MGVRGPKPGHKERKAQEAAQRITIRYMPPPTMKEFHEDDSFVRGVMGPRGSGKSSGCCIEIFSRGLEQRPDERGIRKFRAAIVRDTYPELSSTTLKTWKDWFPRELCSVRESKAPIEAVMQLPLADKTWLDMEVWFIALDKPEHVKKLLSLELSMAWINEARAVPKEILDGLTACVGRYPSKKDGVGCTWCGIIMDTNPPDTDSDWYRWAEEETPEGWRFWQQPPALLWDNIKKKWIPNPDAENIEHLPGGYDYYYRMLPGKTREWIRVYVEGKYGSVKTGKVIYPEYNDDVHYARRELKVYANLPLLLGWDFGLNPTCVIAQLTKRGQLRVIDEYVADDMGVRQFINLVVKPVLKVRYPGMKIMSYGDPAGADRGQTDMKTCFNELTSAGFKVMPAPTNLFTPRREAVAGFLNKMVDGEPGFLLSERCKYLRRGFNGGYKYKKILLSGENRYKYAAEKNKYSHPHDALQYIAVSVEKGTGSVVGEEDWLTNWTPPTRKQVAGGIVDVSRGFNRMPTKIGRTGIKNRSWFLR